MLPRLPALLACGVLSLGLSAQNVPIVPPASLVSSSSHTETNPPDYPLGPGDEVSVHVLDLDEIPDKPIRIDSRGELTIPLAGTIRAEKLSTSQLQASIASRLRAYLKTPEVTVTLTARRDTPVTVLGAVNAPGLHQIETHSNLLDVLSASGGIRPDAGPQVRITRLVSAGPIPLPAARLDENGRFFTAEVDIHSLLYARNPEENIPLRPHDVVTVPPAEMVYVLGEVFRPGEYEMKSGSATSVLNAVALAGGIGHNALSSQARVLRRVPGKPDRTEISVDIHRILIGKDQDFLLQPSDILYLPTNRGKVVTTRALEAMIGTGSSIAVFRGSH